MASGTELARRVEKMSDDIGDNVEDAVEDGLQNTKRGAKAELLQGNNVAHGNLKRFIHVDEAAPWADYRVVADMDYAKYIEYGTGVYADPEHPYKSADPKPPIGPIRQWVIRKGLTANDVELDVSAQSNFIEEQQQIARAIQEVLGAYGNRPHPFMRPAWRRGKQQTVNGARAGISRAVRRF